MRIQNRAFAGVTMRLHNGQDVTGDAQGIFDVGPEDEYLADTAGWSRVEESAHVPPAKLPSLPPPVPPAITEVKAESTGESAGSEGESAGGETSGAGEKVPTLGKDEIDLDAMDREQLEACAEEYGIKIDRRWGDAKLREFLAKELFE